MVASVSLPLSPDILEHTYEFLRATQPFSQWSLPHADEVEFGISRKRGEFGQFYAHSDGRVGIEVSLAKVRATHDLVVTMAHEMCHLRQHRMGAPVDHDRLFHRLAKSVCRRHGFHLEGF